MKPFLAGGFTRANLEASPVLERFRTLQKPSAHHFSEELMSKKLPTEAARQAFEKSTGHSAQIPLTGPFVLLCRVLWFSHWLTHITWLTSQNKLTCASSATASQPAPLSGSVLTARGESCSDYHSSTGQPPKAPSSLLRLQDRNRLNASESNDEEPDRGLEGITPPPAGSQQQCVESSKITTEWWRLHFSIWP